MAQPDISAYIIHLSYFGIFLWFMIIEQLMPVPEEVSLITVGYIAVHMGLNPVLAGMAALTGLLVTDNSLFYLSKKGSHMSQKLLATINPHLLEKIKKKLRANTDATIFVGALLPKFRFFNPIITGSMNFPFRRFFLMNCAATVLYVTFYFCVGIFFHTSLNMILKKMEYVKHLVFIAFMIAMSITLIFVARKMILKKRTSGNSNRTVSGK